MTGEYPYQFPLPVSSHKIEFQTDKTLYKSCNVGFGYNSYRKDGSSFQESFLDYLSTQDTSPLVLEADAAMALGELPKDSVDFVMTSPPYWGKREYDNGGIGLEDSWEEYLKSLDLVFAEVSRILKPSGSFWLNIGDRYVRKGLVGLPWRIALHLTDYHGWILRNSVIWNKVKSGMDSSSDRLGNVYEPIFHFVKNPKGYYYDADSIRSSPGKSRVENGAVVTATGVTGVKYRRQIELSTALSSREKDKAIHALSAVLDEVRLGAISDFRMIIRGQQRVTHSDSKRVSGRAKELEEKGFYFLKYNPKGSKPSDVWDIIPEDTQNRSLHFAPYPGDLCRIPLLATCPQDGIALDPFCGTGTTLRVAYSLGRKSVGIDRSLAHLRLERYRCCRI